MKASSSFTIKFKTFKHKFEIQNGIIDLWAQSNVTPSNIVAAKNQIRRFIKNLTRCSDINESLDELVERHLLGEISKRFKEREQALVSEKSQVFIEDRDIQEDIWDLVCSSFGSFVRRDEGIYCPCGEDKELVFVFRVHPIEVSAHSEFHRVGEYQHRGVTVYVEYNTAVISNDSMRNIVIDAIEKKLILQKG